MMPTCRDVSRSIAAEGVDRLPIFRRLLVGLHLRMCGRCARFARELRWIGQAARTRWASGAEDREALDRIERVVFQHFPHDRDRRDDPPG